MSTSYRMEIQGLGNVLKRIKQKDKEIKKNIIGEFEFASSNIENEAKRRCHVDTGRLKASIKAELKRKYRSGKLNTIDVIVGSDVHYAIYMERYDPYLYPAMEMYRPQLLNRLAGVLGR